MKTLRASREKAILVCSLLLTLLIACSSPTDTAATITGDMSLDNMPPPLAVGLVMNEEDLELWEIGRLLPEPPATYHGNIGSEFGWKTWTTRLDAGGRFVFDALMPGKYHLFAVLEHYKLRKKGRIVCWTDQGIEIESFTFMEGTISKPGPVYGYGLLSDVLKVEQGSQIRLNLHCERREE